jgi:outer membrane lipoprotein SlyB
VADNQQQERERIGSIAGLGAGVIAGAQLGTVLLPIPIVGTFAGALIGGVFGSQVGKTVGAAMLDGISAFTESLSGQRPDDPPPPDTRAP